MVTFDMVPRSLDEQRSWIADRSGAHAVIVAEAQPDGEASVALHRAHGFELVGTEREVGRKFNRWLDVTIMQLLLRRWVRCATM